jgi:hypothetical protein
MELVVDMIGNILEQRFLFSDVKNELDMTAKKNNVCNENIHLTNKISFYLIEIKKKD